MTPPQTPNRPPARLARPGHCTRLATSLALAALLSACQTAPWQPGPHGPLGPVAGAIARPSASAQASAPPVRAPGTDASVDEVAAAAAQPGRDSPEALATLLPGPPAAPGAAPVADPTAIRPDLLAAPDLWGRLRRGFALPALPHPLAEQHARRFAQAAFFTQRTERLRMYLPLIVAELEQRGLPLELAMLPMVESALNPNARSPVGALGTWQFMAPTARRFELRTSRLVDDRQNLQAATRAAMDYLQALHTQFGDWHLAMAAYNWGEGRVQTAVARQRARGLPADFAALADAMPAETRNYVPQIDALRRLVADPERWAAVLPDVADTQPLVTVALAHDTDLALAQRWSGLNERALRAMNPAIRPPLILAAATPRLLMPQDAAERFNRAQAAHSGSTASWSVVRLTATRPVDAIAHAYGTHADAVRALNDIPRGMKPVAGSVLLLPVVAAPGTRASDAVVATAQMGMVADLVKVHTAVRRRETLAEVARRCGVPLDALAGWNGIGRPRWQAKLKFGTPLALWVVRERGGSFQVVPAIAAAPAAARVARSGRSVAAPARRS